MRSFFLFLFLAAAACAQPFTVGVKAGVPLSDFFSTAKSPNFGFNSNTKRYILGGSAELRLPAGFGIEVDALYRHLNYNGSGGGVESETTGSAWEFPLLLKYRFPTPVARPYVEGGIAWDRLSGLTQTVRRTINNITNSSTTSTPAELNERVTKGFVMGVGLDIHFVVHITPEIRYTRWGAKHFLDPNGLLNSNRNQAEFLLGLTF